MERLAPFISKKRNECLLLKSSNPYFIFDASKSKEKVVFKVEHDFTCDLLIDNLNDSLDIEIFVAEGANLNVCFLANKPVNSFKITANLDENANISCYYADFVKGVCKGDATINLNGRNSSCYWHLSSLSQHQDNKEFIVNAIHNEKNTFAQLDCYGVCREEAKLVFSGTCHIKNGSSGSKAHQNAKIMVFDKTSDGIAKPILRIDENDVEASHAAIVGEINDEHIFYLTSRGLSEEEAKRLITFGYLKPIINGFVDEEKKEEIVQLIEGNI